MNTEQQPGEKTPPVPPPTDPKAEIAAMGKAYEALRALDRMSQLRAMRWLNDRLQDDTRLFAGDDEEPF